jgi:electron transfer flavoprotein alpha subunit
MATVRDGVMKKEILDENYQGEVIRHDVAKYVPLTDYVVKVLDRHVEAARTTSRARPSSSPAATASEGGRIRQTLRVAKEIHAR